MTALTTNQLEAFWLPFTPNSEFKRRPRIVSRAEGSSRPAIPISRRSTSVHATRCSP